MLRRNFESYKSYFYEKFRFVNKVEVSAQKESESTFRATVKVFVKGKWLVVKRRGSNLNVLINDARKVMDRRLRKLHNKNKRGPKHSGLNEALLT